MSTGTPPPGGKSSAASIAWAVATIVVALVCGGLIYVAMTNDDGTTGQAGGGGTPTTTAQPTAAAPPTTPAPAPTQAAPTTQARTPAPTAAAPTMTPEQEQFLLSLARRDASDPLGKGDPQAPVVLIEYADYRCPYCAKWAVETLPELQRHIDAGDLRIEFRDTVLFGEESQNAAIAARAAGEQSLYWEYAHAMFADSDGGHPSMPREYFLDLAKEVKVPDLAKFEEDLDSAELKQRVAADQAEAQSLGISSTPTFIVGTTPLQGAQPAQVFDQIIELELTKAQAREQSGDQSSATSGG